MMIATNYITAALLASVLGSCSAIQYTSGSTTVDVVTEYVDAANSTRTCVTYLKGNIPEKYNLACFTTYYTDTGTFNDCLVQFGNEACNFCDACETNDELAGFSIDCFNTQPAENTDGCVELTDRNIQEVLVDTDFSQDFDFSVEEETKDIDDPSTPPSSGAWCVSLMAVLGSMMAFV